MSELYTRFDSVFFERTRLSMMTVLYHEGNVDFKRFKKLFGLSDGGAYAHLEKLLEAGYVGKRRELVDGQPRTIYALSEAGRTAFRDYLDFIGGVIQEGRSGNGEE